MNITHKSAPVLVRSATAPSGSALTQYKTAEIPQLVPGNRIVQPIIEAPHQPAPDGFSTNRPVEGDAKWKRAKSPAQAQCPPEHTEDTGDGKNPLIAVGLAQHRTMDVLQPYGVSFDRNDSASAGSRQQLQQRPIVALIRLLEE
jgi:hypothetical protein